MVICSLCVFVACDDYWESPSIRINDTEYSVPSTASKIEIPIETNVGWRIVSSLPSWIVADKMFDSGSSELILDISANNSGARSHKLMIAASTAVCIVEISQVASVVGTLSVTTGDCYKTGFLGNYSLTMYYTVRNPHLASEVGIEVDGKKYPSDNYASGSGYVEITSKVNITASKYRAYARNKTTGRYVYGSTKTIN